MWANEGQARTKTVTISASSRTTTAQTSAPSNRSARWSGTRGPYSGRYSASIRRYFFAFLLKAGTPPALRIVGAAAGLVRAQSMNFCSVGLTPEFGTTRKR